MNSLYPHRLITPRRLERIERILDRKQPDLQLMLDDVHDSRNLSAILRSSDGAGVLDLYYSNRKDEAMRIHKAITQGSHRWIRRRRIDYEARVDFLRAKQARGFAVVAAVPSEGSVDYRRLDYTLPTLFVLGNEKEGVDRRVVAQADHCVYIPMMGMAQSLNVSVATALLLFEAQRQRLDSGAYEASKIPEPLRAELIQRWSFRDGILRRSRGKIRGPASGYGLFEEEG